MHCVAFSMWTRIVRVTDRGVIAISRCTNVLSLSHVRKVFKVYVSSASQSSASVLDFGLKGLDISSGCGYFILYTEAFRAGGATQCSQ